MNWTQAINEFKYYLQIEKGMSKHTMASYTSDLEKLNQYIQHFNLQETPNTITNETLKEFIYHSAKTLNARSQSRLISSLKSFFKFLLVQAYRSDFPMELIETPKIGLKLPDTLSLDDINKLIEAIDLSQEEGQRNRAIIETLYGCGLRVSELVSLRISDLYFDEDFIQVHGKGNKQRLVPIAPITKNEITKYLELYRPKLKVFPAHQDILFLNRRGKQLTRTMIFTIIKQLTQIAGIQKQVSPHTLRHSFASHLLENGANLRAIQQMLGHESITTTEIYLHTERSYLKKVVDTFHPRAHSSQYK